MKKLVLMVAISLASTTQKEVKASTGWFTTHEQKKKEMIADFIVDALIFSLAYFTFSLGYIMYLEFTLRSIKKRLDRVERCQDNRLNLIK